MTRGKHESSRSEKCVAVAVRTTRTLFPLARQEPVCVERAVRVLALRWLLAALRWPVVDLPNASSHLLPPSPHLGAIDHDERVVHVQVVVHRRKLHLFVGVLQGALKRLHQITSCG